MDKKKRLNIQATHISQHNVFITVTPTETRRLGVKFAKFLKKGDIVLLYGECGSGKTTFVQGIVRAFGNRGFAKSASFMLVNEYNAFCKTKLFHLDLYRLDSVHIYDIGLEEYIYGSNISLIEWPDKIIGLETNNSWKIYLTQEYNSDNINKRIIKIEKIK
jgi:tRNA threonylcarbamoyladenosine biosynthesis protein TsaE